MDKVYLVEVSEPYEVFYIAAACKTRAAAEYFVASKAYDKDQESFLEYIDWYYEEEASWKKFFLKRGHDNHKAIELAKEKMIGQDYISPITDDEIGIERHYIRVMPLQ